MKPKECINSNCTKILYVEDWQLHLDLQCDVCITKREFNEIKK